MAMACVCRVSGETPMRHGLHRLARKEAARSWFGQGPVEIAQGTDNKLLTALSMWLWVCVSARCRDGAAPAQPRCRPGEAPM